MENEHSSYARAILVKAIIAAIAVILIGIYIIPSLIYVNVCGGTVPNKALNNARNIGMALKTFADDHNGEFPKGNTAAEVFSQLLPQETGGSGYIADKMQFYVKNSKYTPKVISDSPGNLRKLSSGENHWAFMSGLSSKGNARWPLLFDGPASIAGRYSADQKEKGGVWKGKIAIVVRLDGSANTEPLQDLYIATDGQENILEPSNAWAIRGKLLMPY